MEFLKVSVVSNKYRDYLINCSLSFKGRFIFFILQIHHSIGRSRTIAQLLWNFHKKFNTKIVGILFYFSVLHFQAIHTIYRVIGIYTVAFTIYGHF